MANSIRDYVSEGVEVSYGLLVNRFGEPKKIASTYIMEMETEELLDSLQTKRIIVMTVTVIVVMAGLWLAMVVDSYVNHKKDMAGYAVVEIIEVERKVIEGGE